MDKPYFPDDDPPRRSLRERLRDARLGLTNLYADASAGVRAEWRNLTTSHPWLKKHKRLIAAGAAAVVILPPALLWAVLHLREGSHAPTGLGARVLFDAPGEKLHPALSADGSRIAFVWDGGQPGGNYDIYIMSTAAEDKGKSPQRVTSNPAPDLRPSWSPDGSRLAFLRNAPDRIQLIFVTLQDGQELTSVAIEPKGWYQRSLDPLMRAVDPGPEWSDDGEAVFVTDSRNADLGVPLWRVDAATSQREQITHPGEFNVDCYPLRMRSGREMAFLRRRNAHSAEVYRLDPSNGVERQLTDWGFDLRGATLMPGGRELITSSEESGRHQLRYLNRSGVSEPLGVPGDYNYEPVYTGRKLAWLSMRQSSGLVELPLELGEPPAEPVLRPVQTPPGRNHSPAFSPDGRDLAWVSDTQRNWELWIKSGDAEPRRASNLGLKWGARMTAGLQWSPDGRRLVFESRPGSHSTVTLTDPAAGQIRVFEGNNYNEERPTWSNDGKFIYFGTDRDWQMRIWRRQFAGGLAVRVTSHEGQQAFESADGNMLYFVPGNLNPGIWAMPAAGGEEAVIPETARFHIRGHWAPGPAGIFLMGYDNEPRTLYVYRFATQSLHPVMTLPKLLPANVPAMAVDRAGTRLVLAQEDLSSSEIMIAER